MQRVFQLADVARPGILHQRGKAFFTEPQLRPAPAPDAALQRFPVEIDGRRVVLGLPVGLLSGLGGTAGAGASAGASASDATELRAPAPGTLVRWLADDGTQVEEGDPVAVLDAMKMETTVAAHRAGVLSHRVELSAAIAPDAVLAVIS